MRAAVITIAHGRHDHWRMQRAALGLSRTAVDDHVLVAMDDRGYEDAPRGEGAPAPRVLPLAVHPEGLPLAAARNLGARAALDAGAELLIFLDVDCLPGPELVGGYVAAARAAETTGVASSGAARSAPESPGLLLCGPVTYLSPPGPEGYDLSRLDAYDSPHPARPAPARGETILGGRYELFWSLSFAMDAATWDLIGGFHEGYIGYGAEDTDFAQRARAAGVELAWVGDARAYHQHHPTQDPPVQHVDDILRNGAIFARLWGWWPMQGWLDGLERAGLIERDTRGDYRRTLSA